MVTESVANGTGQPMNDNNKFNNSYLPVIIKDLRVHLMISILGSLSFAKLVMMSSIPAKSVGGRGGGGGADTHLKSHSSMDSFNTVPHNLASNLY